MKGARWLVVLLILTASATVAACVQGPTIPEGPDDVDDPNEEDTISVVRSALDEALRDQVRLQVRIVPLEDAPGR